MKAISTLIASVLVIASFQASANENKGKTSIKTPSPTEYAPEDVNTVELEKLKSTYTFRLPNIPEINQADVDVKEMEQLKVLAPEMTWGNPSDVDTDQLETLKTTDAQERKF
jgi:hypothetical protein